MLPWGHLAVGYLCYSLGIRLRYRRPPEGTAVLALALGTQFPDLIDKPLSWTFGILPSGRSLGHSLLFAIVVGVIVWRVGRRYDRRPAAVAFLIGHLSHVIADVLPALYAGQWIYASSLLWPLVPAYEFPGELDRSIIEFLLTVEFSTLSVMGVGLSVIALGLWVYDGVPVLRPVIDFVRTRDRDPS